MPITRSQHNATPPRQSDSTGESSTEAGTTTTSTTATGTSTSAATTTTESTSTGKVKNNSREEDVTRRAPAGQEEAALPRSGSHMTLVAIAPSRRARSTRTNGTRCSAARRRRLEAEEELARLEFAEAQAATRLARARLHLTQQEEDDASTDEDPEDRTAQVQDWIQASSDVQRNTIEVEQRAPDPPKPPQQPAKTENASSEIRLLADLFRETIASGQAQQPKYLHELPSFNGDSSEWIAFKTVFEDTSSLFSETQNMARLRRAVTGTAREAFKSLLYSEASPQEVMKALQRRFGRTDALVLAELEKLKALPKLTDNPRDVCLFASQLSNGIAAIQGLKKPQYLHAPEIMNGIVDKLTSSIKYRWFDFTHGLEDGSFSNLALISQFMNKEADKCGPYASMENPKKPEERKRPVFRHAAHTAADQQPVQAKRDIPEQGVRKFGCPLCQERHPLWECQRFIKMSTDDRWGFVKKQRLCFKCLSQNHRKEACRRSSCRICGRGHNRMLHVERNREEVPEAKTTESGTTTNVASPINALQAARAYLKMAPVEVYGPKGSVKIIALLDEGSTVSLLDAEVAEQIGATGRKEELVLETVGGRILKDRDSMQLKLRIKGVHEGKMKNINRLRTIENLKLAPQFLDIQRIRNCAHLENIADVLYYGAEPPKLLIGQDNWELIVSRSVKKGPPGQPVASYTNLGWVLHGFDNKGSKPVNFINNCMHVNSIDEEMHQVIKDHFAIESLGVQPKRPSTDCEGRAMEILNNTCKRLSDGRFEVGLLWKKDNELLPESYSSAERRLRGIEKKLVRDAQLQEEYTRQIQHLLDNGYAEEVKDNKNAKVWYLPHFPVTHPVKKKIRIVFDAAARSGGKSLNDVLLPGPDLLRSLFGVLLRFRQGPEAVAADIKEMFLQVRIRPEDRDCLRFLWRGTEPNAEPTTFRMTSVIFGAASSPCTAIYVKNRNAADFANQYPEAAEAVDRNHYMDDYLHSFHSEREMVKISKQVSFIHSQAGFELRGWASNRPDLLREICGKSEDKTEVDIGCNEEKTLGLRWWTKEDCLGFRAQLRNTPAEVLLHHRYPTKREVTSAVMSTFDPLGLAAPILIQGKKLLQNIWRSGVGWDDDVQEKEIATWKSYLENLQILKDLLIPRCIAPDRTEGELHVFSDASEEAYAAAVYWRTGTSSEDIRISLVAAKARVTPLKPVSIPRLELQAALLGSRLADSIKTELSLKVENITYWTDSSIVLAWIKSDPRSFKTFVAHRLAEIEDLTRPQQWRWVPTALNPADDATRGVPEDFAADHRWFVGPEFLRRDEQHWPAPRTFKKASTGEEKEEVVAATTSSIQRATPDPERFSTWPRLWRATARMLQFVQLCRLQKKKVLVSRKTERADPTWGRRKKKIGNKKTSATSGSSEVRYAPIPEELLERARQLLLRASQEECFKEEMKRLQQKKPLENSSKLKKLDVDIEDNLIKLRGRIDAARIVGENYKHPIILDSNSRIVKLLIEDYHRKFNHGNHATVMNELRQHYLILGLRSALRAIQHHCQWCRMMKAKPKDIATGNLPPERLQHGSPPFTCTAVDYFGPLSITVGRRREKRWGALFTCLTTRAVHIELAASLSSGAMIMALRRLAARRGMPRTIYSDNGTNFVGANKELKEAWKTLQEQDIVNEAEKIGVRWKFIPPGAPNMGGAWERMVRSVKTALEATLRERHPSEETLHTLLLEAEHIVNSRPLTHLAENPDEEALTPNHFLIGRSCGSARVGAFDDGELVGRATWKTTQRLADHFWQRWLREYLPTLLPRRISGRTETPSLQIGDVVLIVDSSLPRCTWPRGRIVRTYPGPDGRTRVVDVDTRGGILRRPSSRIVLLVPEPSPSQGIGAAHEGENVGDR